MLEHQIRLRRGWEYRETGSPGPEVRRFELPTRWNFDIPKRLTLTRRFGRPALDPIRQVLTLEMEQVIGIHAIFLNGQSIGPVSAATSQYSIELGLLAERNVLVLEIEMLAPAAQTEDWGVIALVVRSIEHADDSVVGPIAPGIVDELYLE